MTRKIAVLEYRWLVKYMFILRAGSQVTWFWPAFSLLVVSSFFLTSWSSLENCNNTTTMSNDQKVQVAVRVRPFNRRGKSNSILPNIVHLLIFCFHSKLCKEIELGTKCIVDMVDSKTILHHPSTPDKPPERSEWQTYFLYIFWFCCRSLSIRELEQTEFLIDFKCQVYLVTRTKENLR